MEVVFDCLLDVRQCKLHSTRKYGKISCCSHRAYLAVFLSCISQLLSQVTVPPEQEQSRRVCLGPNKQRCGHDHAADEENDPSPQLAWAVDLTKQNKQSLSEPVRRVHSGSLSGEMAQFQTYMWTWRCTHQLSAIYKWDGDFTVGQHSQLFPEFIDPTQEDLTMCVRAEWDNE